MVTRFALLRHDVPADFGRPSHWDLLLERGESCWTWAMEQLPGLLSGQEGATCVDARRLVDHRLHYLDHEGPVGGDRGEVRRFLSGECRWIGTGDARVHVQLESSVICVNTVIEWQIEDRWKLSVQ